MKEKTWIKEYLLNFSGEALAGAEGYGIDTQILDYIAEEIKSPSRKWYWSWYRNWRGNIIRGVTAAADGVIKEQVLIIWEC